MPLLTFFSWVGKFVGFIVRRRILPERPQKFCSKKSKESMPACNLTYTHLRREKQAIVIHWSCTASRVYIKLGDVRVPSKTLLPSRTCNKPHLPAYTWFLASNSWESPINVEELVPNNRKSQYGHGVCCMSTARRNGVMWTIHTPLFATCIHACQVHSVLSHVARRQCVCLHTSYACITRTCMSDSIVLLTNGRLAWRRNSRFLPFRNLRYDCGRFFFDFIRGVRATHTYRYTVVMYAYTVPCYRTSIPQK